MKVYVDLLLFLNFAFDFLLLLTTSLVLKRRGKIFNIVFGAFIGSLSILVLFFNVNSFELFLIKIYLSIIMCLVAFNYKGFKYTLVNIFSFYLVSILFGGFLYLLNIEFSYKHNGLIFYNNGLSVNIIVLFILSPIILYIYIKQSKFLARRGKNYYKVDLYVGEKLYNFVGYLDTGNSLVYKGMPVIFVNKKIIYDKEKIMVPYVVIGHAGILECVSAKVVVHDLGMFNVLIGYDENISVDGVDVLLNSKMEGKYD